MNRPITQPYDRLKSARLWLSVESFDISTRLIGCGSTAARLRLGNVRARLSLMDRGFPLLLFVMQCPIITYYRNPTVDRRTKTTIMERPSVASLAKTTFLLQVVVLL
jgi:hypothetical protein